MDPNTALKELLDLARQTREMNDSPDPDLSYMQDFAVQMADKLLGLDFWITTGGFLPDRWRKS